MIEGRRVRYLNVNSPLSVGGEAHCSLRGAVKESGANDSHVGLLLCASMSMTKST